MAKPPVEEKSVQLKNDKKGEYQKRLAIHILLMQQKKVIDDRIKANLKAATDHGIPGKKLVTTQKLAKEAPSKIAQHYAEEFEMLEFQGINITTQFNLLGGADVTVPKRGPDFYGPGLMAALDGKDGNPPKNLKAGDMQRWLEGWNDGVAARMFGMEYLETADAQARAAGNDGKGPEKDPDQTDIEDSAVTGPTIRIGLSDFGPNAKLEDIEIGDCDLTADEIQDAVKIEVVDADGRANVLKNRAGPTGMQDGFPMTQEEIALQKARPSTIAATDPAATTH